MAEQPDDNDHWPEDDSGDESVSPGEGRSFFSTWGWPLFGLAAFVIFELTASLMWSSLVFALRFGWKDVYAGWYLWNRDPFTARGRTVGLTYFVQGMYRSSGVAYLMIFLWFLLTIDQSNLNPNKEEQLWIAMFALICVASLISVIVVIVVRCLARRHKILVWIDPDGYSTATRKEWPPVCSSSNHFIWVCWYAALSSTVMTSGIAIPISTWAKYYGIREEMADLPTVGLMIFLLFCFYTWLTSGTVASTPGQCWSAGSSQGESSDIVEQEYFND